MDIDPRLHPLDENHTHNRSDARHPTATTTATAKYVPSPVSGSSDTGTHSDYPDPPVGRTVTSSEARGNTSYYGADTATPDPHHHHQPGTSTNFAASPSPNSPHYLDLLKRPRACEPCRQLKVRCEPDANNPGGVSCKRCAKTEKQCVVTAPTRKRQKKTDSRVAELERKIDALTASLHASDGQSLPQQQPGPGAGPSPGSRRWLGARQNVTPGPGVKRRYSGGVKDSSGKESAPTLPPFSYPNRPASPHETKWRGAWSSEPRTGGFVDVIDKGLVTVETALKAFDHYVNNMSPHLPIVVFPPGTQMHDIRRSKPVLFHTIIAVAIGPMQPDIQLSLFDDFWKILAESVVVKGEKSFDLVQAILVANTWYLPPDHYEQLKFFQLVHMAVTLAMDIGMFRRTKTAKKQFNLVRDIMGKKAFSLDLDSPETRRAWLGCYYLVVQVSAALRRPPLLRWHPYMEECIEILDNSPDALPSDKALIRWVKLAQITEEVGFHFSYDEPDSNPRYADPKVQHTLKVLEKQLEQWRRETPVDIYSTTMKQSDYLLNTYIHEPTMHIESTSGDERLTSHECLAFNTVGYINAITTCGMSIHRTLDVILSMDTRDLLCLPTYVLARASYSIVALIRLYAILTGPDKVCDVIEPTSLKVEYYLDRVVEQYKAAGEHTGGRTPGKFSIILDLLRNWFIKQKDQNSGLKEALSGDGKTAHSHCEGLLVQHEEAESNRTVPNTPLHLLSEVASRPSSSAHAPFQRGYGAATASDAITHHPASIDSLVSQPLQGPDQQQQQQQQWMQYPQLQYPQSSYPDPTTTGTTTTGNSNQIFVPELGVHVDAGFDPENLLAWGNMLGDGFFNFPFAVDGSMGFW